MDCDTAGGKEMTIQEIDLKILKHNKKIAKLKKQKQKLCTHNSQRGDGLKMTCNHCGAITKIYRFY